MVNNDITTASPLIEGILHIHKIITRGLTTSLSKCDEYLSKQGITPGETEGFFLYLTTLRSILHGHHLSEDEIAFPYFKNKIEAPFDKLKDDHREMARILDKLEECLLDMSQDGIHKLRDVFNTLNKIWGPHIKIEEENFTVEKLQTVIGFKEQLDITKRLSAHGMKNSGPGPQTVPFLFYNLEGSDREAFMRNFPWIVKKVLVPVFWREKWRPMKEFLT
jgi:hypothetical protein